MKLDRSKFRNSNEQNTLSFSAKFRRFRRRRRLALPGAARGHQLLVPDVAGATGRAGAEFAGCSIARRTTLTSAKCLADAKDYDHVIINTSTPSLKNDCKVAEAIKRRSPDTKIGFVGAHTAVLPAETLKASPAIDWVGRKEFDFTCKEVAEGRDLATIAGLSYRDKDGKIKHNPEREMIQDMDALPWVADVYKRDLQDREVFHRLPAASLREPLHRPRLPGAMHLLPLAADHRRPQIPRPLAAECRRRNGLHEEAVPAGAGVFLRRRHLHRQPAARPRDRQETRPARRRLELQQPRQPRLRHHQSRSRTPACACSWSATKAATRRSSPASRRA